MIDYKKYIKVIEIIEKSEESSQEKAKAICELMDVSEAKVSNTPFNTTRGGGIQYIPCTYPIEHNKLKPIGVGEM